MNLVAVNVLIIICGIALMISLPFYFKRKNAMDAANAKHEEYLKDMLRIDKNYAPYQRQLSKNLNIINYWLKTGKDPAESEEDSENVEKADRFFAGLMNPVEAKKWKESIKKARESDEDEYDVKSLRVDEFSVTNMEPTDLDQTEAHFYYSHDYGENIFYCVTLEAFEKRYYRNILYFTTARPTNLPLVYPYKYEGAQMLSLYNHPSQAVWFLKNWKMIREGLEGQDQEVVPIDESVTEDFDL
ncbi:MAG: hypothetical protein IKP29_00725 [Pseudobutyrivibrio sp.]|nr:hypothetical protein [Pseudobutyrivibrio sp.]